MIFVESQESISCDNSLDNPYFLQFQRMIGGISSKRDEIDEVKQTNNNS